MAISIQDACFSGISLGPNLDEEVTEAPRLSRETDTHGVERLGNFNC